MVETSYFLQFNLESPCIFPAGTSWLNLGSAPLALWDWPNFCSPQHVPSRRIKAKWINMENSLRTRVESSTCPRASHRKCFQLPVNLWVMDCGPPVSLMAWLLLRDPVIGSSLSAITNWTTIRPLIVRSGSPMSRSRRSTAAEFSIVAAVLDRRSVAQPISYTTRKAVRLRATFSV